MKKLLVLALKLVTTGTLTLFMAACYGVMNLVDLRPSKTITALSPQHAGVKDLDVTLHDPSTAVVDEATTDAAGVAVLHSSSPMEGWTATIEDVDGSLNGGPYAKTQVVLDERQSYTVELKLE